MNLKHLKCKFPEIGVNFSFYKILSVKDPLFLQIKKRQKHQMCVMKFVSHREMAFILIGRSVTQQFCFFKVNLCVPVHSMT